MPTFFRKRLSLARPTYPAPIRKILKNLRQVKQTTSYPFLIHVLDDYKQGTINEDTLRQTLELILSYLVRRSVCGIPSNSLRGLFIYLYNRVFKVSANKRNIIGPLTNFIIDDAALQTRYRAVFSPAPKLFAGLTSPVSVDLNQSSQWRLCNRFRISQQPLTVFERVRPRFHAPLCSAVADRR